MECQKMQNATAEIECAVCQAHVVALTVIAVLFIVTLACKVCEDDYNHRAKLKSLESKNEETRKSLEAEKIYTQWLQRQLQNQYREHPNAYIHPNIHHAVHPLGPAQEC
jgi:septal ring factor EnvC (AmiA/AmiB activator)